MNAVKTAAHQSPPEPVSWMLTGEELEKKKQEELGELIDVVIELISSLNEDDEEMGQKISSIRRSSGDLASLIKMEKQREQLKARIAALHGYRENIIRHWRKKEGL